MIYLLLGLFFFEGVDAGKQVIAKYHRLKMLRYCSEMSAGVLAFSRKFIESVYFFLNL